MTEDRAVLDAAAKDKLDDSDFAFVDSDGDGHLPIHDAAHVRAALSRFTQTSFPDAATKKSAANKILAAAKKFDITVDPDSPVAQAARTAKPRHKKMLETGAETRTFTSPIEIRDSVPSETAGSEEDGTNPNPQFVNLRGTVVKYGATYPVNDMFGSFNETIHRGAATDVLAGDPDIRFLINHEGIPLARTGSQTCPLTVTEDDDGIQVEARVDTSTSAGADLVAAIRNGLISQMSIGMQVDQDGDLWSNPGKDGLPTDRNITKLSGIFDTSAVTYPASPTTSISARSAMAYEAARNVRSGRATQEEGELAMRVLELFAEENRAAPTAADPKITDAITAAKTAVTTAIGEQSKDPDNNTDPVDKKVMAALQAAEQALVLAAAAQAKDASPDKEDPPAEPETDENSNDGTQADAGETEDDGANNDATRAMKAAAWNREMRRRAIAVKAARSRLGKTHRSAPAGHEFYGNQWGGGGGGGTPSVGDHVGTPLGDGTVTKVSNLTGNVMVQNDSTGVIDSHPPSSISAPSGPPSTASDASGNSIHGSNGKGSGMGMVTVNIPTAGSAPGDAMSKPEEDASPASKAIYDAQNGR